MVAVPEGRLVLQGLRSHDQFNTTIYGLSDRYRGISGGRRVVFLHADDIAAFGFADGDLVDLVSEWEDGTERSVPSFRIVEYDTPRGCAAAYYPEVNPLEPAGRDGRREQPAHLQVDHHPAREGDPRPRRVRGGRRSRRVRPRPQVRRRSRTS